MKKLSALILLPCIILLSVSKLHTQELPAEHRCPLLLKVQATTA